MTPLRTCGRMNPHVQSLTRVQWDAGVNQPATGGKLFKFFFKLQFSILTILPQDCSHFDGGPLGGRFFLTGGFVPI